MDTKRCFKRVFSIFRAAMPLLYDQQRAPPRILNFSTHFLCAKYDFFAFLWMSVGGMHACNGVGIDITHSITSLLDKTTNNHMFYTLYLDAPGPNFSKKTLF